MRLQLEKDYQSRQEQAGAGKNRHENCHEDRHDKPVLDEVESERGHSVIDVWYAVCGRRRAQARLPQS